MKIKSSILSILTLAATFAFGKEGDKKQTYLRLTSSASDNLYLASLIIKRHSDEVGNKNYQITIDGASNLANVILDDQGSASRLEELIGKLRAEFGDDLGIQIVPVDEMHLGTQDFSMGSVDHE